MGNLTSVKSLVTNFGDIVQLLIPIAFAAAVIFFFWGLAKFILHSSSDDAKDEGKRLMIWGVVAIFIMASIWGIVAYMNSALGINNQTSITPPKVNF
jgi:prolipoprotein diacylglyceryltransferase